MTWNWQHDKWPSFEYNPERLAHYESSFLEGAGRFIGATAHLDSDDQSHLTVELLSNEGLGTSEIEGELLERSGVQSSIQWHLGLKAGAAAGPAESGIAELMVDVYTNAPAPFSEEMVCTWNEMILRGSGARDAGRYRSSPGPMQIVSGPMHNRTVHFEAPPSSAIPAEMDAFLVWFNRTAAGGTDPLPPVSRAGIAHLYFECIHPFEDGNGRVGRAIAEKALAQGVSRPVITGLSTVILRRRKDYYRILAASNRSLEITDWLVWFGETVLEAQELTMARVTFTIEKTRLIDRMRGLMNERQGKALLRMLREGPDGFKGGLSAGNYMSITGASPATSTRDLVDLVEKGALRREGERRYTRYLLGLS